MCDLVGHRWCEIWRRRLGRIRPQGGGGGRPRGSIQLACSAASLAVTRPDLAWMQATTPNRWCSSPVGAVSDYSVPTAITQRIARPRDEEQFEVGAFDANEPTDAIRGE